MEKAPQHPPNRSNNSTHESARKKADVIQFPDVARRTNRRKSARRAADAELREYRALIPKMVDDYRQLRAEFDQLKSEVTTVHSNCVLAKAILRGD